MIILNSNIIQADISRLTIGIEFGLLMHYFCPYL